MEKRKNMEHGYVLGWIFVTHKHPARYHYDNLPLMEIAPNDARIKSFDYINNIPNLLALDGYVNWLVEKILSGFMQAQLYEHDAKKENAI